MPHYHAALNALGAVYYAAGLVGEGSECLGFDDEISRDHDWGPGFCLWLTEEDLAVHGKALREAYSALPREYLGVRRLRESEHSRGRVGVSSIPEFYGRFLGPKGPPETLTQWLTVSDQALSVCTNGRVFQDVPGEFTRVREKLLAGYPEDVRRKRLAAQCAKAAQAGQYNHPRCVSRGDGVAALRALGEFLDHAQAVVFLLIRELEEQGLTDSKSDFLLDHGEKILASVRDKALRSLPMMLG